MDTLQSGKVGHVHFLMSHGREKDEVFIEGSLSCGTKECPDHRHVVVFFKTGVTSRTAKKIVKSRGGRITRVFEEVVPDTRAIRIKLACSRKLFNPDLLMGAYSDQADVIVVQVLD